MDSIAEIVSATVKGTRKDRKMSKAGTFEPFNQSHRGPCPSSPLPLLAHGRIFTTMVSDHLNRKNCQGFIPVPQLTLLTRVNMKTRRRMARERRGAGSSLVSMETPYYKTIY